MTVITPSDDPSTEALDQLEGELRDLTTRWLPRAGELRCFLERWGQAWNSHNLEELEKLVAADVSWDDPAMHGQPVHGRAEFRAFAETFFRAFPDVSFQAIGTPYVDLEGTGIGIRWRMTGTFTGELAIWGAHSHAQPSAAQLPTVPPTGKHFEIEGLDLYELRDGMVSNYSILYDLMELSRQLGLFS